MRGVNGVALGATWLLTGACTSLLGVDGTYEVGAGGDGPGTSASTSLASTNAVITSAGPGGGGSGGASEGGGGGDPGVPEPTCDLCRVDTIVIDAPAGRRPRIAQRTASLELSFLNDVSVQLRGDGGGQQTHLHAAPPFEDAVLASGYDVDTALVWLTPGGMTGLALFADPFGADAIDMTVRRAPIDAAQVADTVYVGANTDIEGPGLLACSAAGCTRALVCPTYDPAARNDVAVTRYFQSIYFARRCEGQLLLDEVGGDTSWAPGLTIDELAASASIDGPVVLAVDGAGADSARVRVHTAQVAGSELSVPGARDPAVVDLNSRVLGAVTRPTPDGVGTTLGLIFCADRDELTTCNVHDLVAVGPDGRPLDLAGAARPSLGFIDTRAVWIAWEQDGVVHVGRLSGP